MHPWTSLAPAGPGALRASWWSDPVLPFSTVSATTRQVRKKGEGGLLGPSGGSLEAEGIISIAPSASSVSLLAPAGSLRENIWHITKAPGLTQRS